MLLALLGVALAQCVCPADDVWTCGHRGYGGSSAGNPWPENTLAAIGAARDAGVDMVEVDVALTADGEVVLMHDASVDRTTDGSGCVADLTLRQLRQLDAGVPSMTGQGVTVPTLAEALAIDIGFDIEFKVHSGGSCPDTDVTALARAVVKELGDVGDRPLVVTSFNTDALDAVRAENSDLRLGWITSEADRSRAADYDAIVPRVDIALKDGYIAAAHDEGLEVYTWVVLTPQVAETLLDEGAEMLMADDPAMLADAVDAWCTAWCADNPAPETPEKSESSGCGCAETQAGPADWMGRLVYLLKRRG